MLEVLSTLAAGNLDLSKEGVNRVSVDVPNFARDIKPEHIRSFDDANEPIILKTRNEDLSGSEHAETNVPFNEKVIQTDEGIFSGVFPEFPVTYEMKLDESLYQESDAKQFKTATEGLKNEINTNPDLLAKFSDRQIEQINNGKVPEGYVWHHNEQPGVMQLVDRSVHENTAHTGGRSIWGGGSDYR
ncbi:HNH endonuclease [Paenibacillus sp. Soil724D2]|uniref:HNH endonuclease n=1 Tax=Paenibacillus sp. (strain Soil724D2) TaxID=1736392 RepID=UPI000715C09E|nr:HNH endonuclease [Paenibacillus sp. Soil724D2]KRE50629.1 hypothetical protein ASG85_20460 [Paenibacillus sp. Soil724D2]